MGVNFAELVLGARTEGLLKGKAALEATTKAGGQTEKAVVGTEKGFNRAGRAAGAAAPRIEGFNKSADRARGVALAATKALAGMAATYATFQAAGQAINVARDFNAALAETSTLIEGTPQQLDAITDAARSMAKEFGGNATEQVKAYYQALSAGADGVEGATRLLDQANRLAIGGVTDVTTGVDALTTAMNAYGADVLSASEASDAMFVAMRAGKTTIGELAGSLGQIVPIASSAGVSFDEVTAGIAALTTQGLSTASATTGLRQVLASVIAPTKQATDAAEALGIQFDVQALKSQGLAGFLEEVIQKTGGNEAAMAQLFGSVEALGAALAFAGGAGGAFSTILTDMETKAGATDAAYEKMAESLDQRWSRITAAAADIALGFGNTLLAVVVPAMEGIAAVSLTVGQNLDVVTVAITALAATQIPSAIAGFTAMTAGMSASAVAAGVFTAAVNVARGAVIALGGPLGLIYGILGASAAAWALWDRGAADGETASYDAATGTSALLGQLDEFYQTSAPAAGAAAIALANDNYKLAASSFEAAKAELAKRRAYAAGAAANNAPGPVQRNAEMRANDVNLLNQVAEAEAALAQAMRDRKVAANAVTGSMSEVIAANNTARKSTKDFTVNVETNTDSLGGNSKAASGAAKAMKKAAKDAEALADEIQRLEWDADPIAKYAAEIEHLDDLLKHGLSDGAYQHAVEKLNDELSRSNPIVNSLSDAFGDFIAGGLRDIDNLLDAFKGTLRQMIAAAISNPIRLAFIGGATGGLSGTAAQAAGAPGGGGLLGNLLGIGGGAGGGLLGSFGNTGSILGVGGLGGGTGLMGGIGNAISGGLGNIFSIGANAAAAGGGFMATIGAAVPVIGLAAAAISFFSSKTKLLDSGLRITADATSTLVEEFEKIEKSRFWGLSKSRSTNYSPMEDDGPIKDAVDEIKNSALAMGDVLGLSADNFSSFASQISVSLKDLSEEEAQAEIQRAFGVLAEQFSYAALGHFQEELGNVIREGETADQALSALASSLQTANIAFRDLGFTMYETSVAGGVAAREFADLFGGVEQMAQATSAYYQRFYTDAEQVTNATRNMREAMAELGLIMPATIEGFRALVEQAERMGNMDKVASLISLSGAFANMIDGRDALNDAALNKATQDVQAAFQREMEATRAAFQSAISGLQNELTGARERLAASRAIANALESALQSRVFPSVEAERQAQDRAAAYLRTLVGQGQINDLDALQAALQAVANPSADTYATLEDYRRDFNMTSGVIKELERTAGATLSADQQAVNLLERQITSAESAANTQIGLLEAQLNALLGIGENMSLEEAIAQFKAAQTAAANPTTSVGDPIEKIYQDVLGRSSDAAGKAFYQGLLDSGALTVSDIRDSIAGSNEALTGVVPSFAGGGYTGNAARSGGLDGKGGFMAMLHPRETVTDHTQGGNGELVAELRRLRAEVAELKSINITTARNTGKSAALAQKRDDIGTLDTNEGDALLVKVVS